MNYITAPWREAWKKFKAFTQPMTTPTPTKKGIALWWGNHPEWLSLPFVAIPPFIQAYHIEQGENQCAFFVVEGRNEPLRYYIKRPVNGKLELYGPAYEKAKE